jgi:iron complex outermembrane recepter protein
MRRRHRHAGHWNSSAGAGRATLIRRAAPALVVAVCWEVSASAQVPTPSPTAAPQSDAIAEIIVTAQKRDQNMQDVPIAVTALSPQTLQVNRVTTINDLTGLAPGLLSMEDPGANASPSFSMRGVFATAAEASQDREISLYLDGVYVGGTRGSVFDLPDLDRIEVLRGPQGTLFGRNATAGAISAVTRDPSGELQVRQDLTEGNYDQFRTRTSIDTPQFGPFSAYFTYVHDERRGDVRNLGAGTQFDRTSPFYDLGVTTSPTWLGSDYSNTVFAALKFEPVDNFKMLYKFDWSHTNDTPSARSSVAINPNSVVGGLLQAVIAAQPPGGGPYGPFVSDPSNKRPDAVNNAWSMPGFAEAYGHNLTAIWQIADDLILKNITAYRDNSTLGIASFTGVDGLVTPAFLGGDGKTYFMSYAGNQTSFERQFSSETQLNYMSRLLTLSVGALYYHSYEGDDGIPGQSPTFAFEPIPFEIPLGNIQDSLSKTRSIAGYVQGEFHLTPQLDLVAGGRVTNDKKDTNLITGGTFVGSRTGAGEIVGTSAYPATFSSTKPTYSVGLNYKPDGDMLLYGKVSTAFLSGGAVGPISFQPETVLSEEIGLKSEFLERRLRVNLAAWNAVYDHQQSAQSGSVVEDPNHPGQTLSQLGVVVIDNGTLRAKGVEAELTAAPMQGVTLGGSAAYTDAHLADPNPLVAQGQPYEVVRVVPWMSSLYGQYESAPIVSEANLFFRLDANYQGRYRALTNPDIGQTIPAFAPYEFSPARWILNSRLALQNIKVGPATGEVAFWVRNLTNNRDVSFLLQFGDFQLDSNYQAARTFGVDLTFKFK